MRIPWLLLLIFLILSCQSLNKPKPFGGLFKTEKTITLTNNNNRIEPSTIRIVNNANVEKLTLYYSIPQTEKIVALGNNKKNVALKGTKDYHNRTNNVSKSKGIKTAIRNKLAGQWWIAFTGGLMALSAFALVTKSKLSISKLKLWASKNKKTSQTLVVLSQLLTIPGCMILGENMRDLNVHLSSNGGAIAAFVSLLAFFTELKFRSIKNVYSSNLQKLIPAVLLISSCIALTTIGSKNTVAYTGESIVSLHHSVFSKTEHAVAINQTDSEPKPPKTKGEKLLITILISMGITVLIIFALILSCAVGCILASLIYESVIGGPVALIVAFSLAIFLLYLILDWYIKIIKRIYNFKNC